MDITYAIEEGLSVNEFIDVLKRSGLAARRPVDEPARIEAMLANANLVVSARDETGRLIGVARSITDFAYCCYLSDLAVDAACQDLGIGRELMRRTHEAAGGTEDVTMVLLAAPDSMDYYPKAGLAKLDTCFGVRRSR